jgi:hypothetical protein
MQGNRHAEILFDAMSKNVDHLNATMGWEYRESSDESEGSVEDGRDVPTADQLAEGLVNPNTLDRGLGKLSPELVDADITYYTQRREDHTAYTYVITNLEGTVCLGQAMLARPDLGMPTSTAPPPRKLSRQWPAASRTIGEQRARIRPPARSLTHQPARVGATCSAHDVDRPGPVGRDASQDGDGGYPKLVGAGVAAGRCARVHEGEA